MIIRILLSALTILCVKSAVAESHVVEMKSISYSPKQLTIKTGDKVSWKNVSFTQHSATVDDAPATASDSKFDTGLIAPKASSAGIEFKKAGTFQYHCSVHGKTMSGQITVTP